ncbi:glycerate kinase [uncultured Tenacibaculum sp.]|uniref:glycerate kinase n=1 Tax=uncultured Tenacibaculum sp. TaxID=174713 RepID=UPI00261E7C71|nr:glycerate kinase [uncultured Tenacibaculum sp.]
MRIVIAPDKFKGTLSSFEFCDIFKNTLQNFVHRDNIKLLPLADGGDGTIDIAQYYLGGNLMTKQVKSAYLNEIEASYLYSETTKTAFIEMAEASGMKALIGDVLNVKKASTFGTGELIIDALEKGAETIIIGLGGSATNDCGIGMATALGYEFYDVKGNPVHPIGENLNEIEKVSSKNIHPKLQNTTFKIACDVTNPLYGPNGASHVYAKQKGASESDIILLENGMIHLSKVLDDHFNTQTQKIVGGGAAGGMGVGCHIFLKGELISGINLIKELANFNEVIQDADWIITGEGKLDEQTKNGKTIQGILQARNLLTKVAVFCGEISLTSEELKHFKIDYAKDIINIATDVNDAFDRTKFYLKELAEKFVEDQL